MIRSNNYQPFMAYLTPKTISALKKFSKSQKIPMAQVVREAITAKLSNGDPYVSGYNAGLSKSIQTVHDMQPLQMKFPSGQSFAELVSSEIIKHKMTEGEKNEGTEGGQESVSGV